ncbi:MAG TPA: phosphoglycerate dehydrogenase [Polyangiaceae bacterium]|nr:phosphoglycerate dehydrogenase [Polyangiaceae bacterium]
MANAAPSRSSSYPKEMIKVLLLENIHESAIKLFEHDGFQVESVATALSEDELGARIEQVQVLGIRSKTLVTAKVLGNAKRLLSLGCFCIGTNQVDLAAANARGVPVFNAPFSNTRSVAEMIIAEIVVLARQIGDRSREVHAGKWRKLATQSHEIRGKTLGIIGYGHIGRQVGVLAEGMGMRVVFYDRTTKLSMGNNRACTTLPELLAESDFVTLHVPATRETQNMIGAEQLAQMKRGAYLLNASRGTVVQIPALADAIKRGQVGGAAIDVFPEEPESNGDGFVTELQNLPNVVLTPHVGGSTGEAQEAIGKEVATSLLKFVNHGTTRGAVNFPQIEMPHTPGAHRILNVHRNVPGVLRDVNHIVSSLHANILGQTLSTDSEIGYLVTDLEHDVSKEVCEGIASLATSIRTRILY